VGGGQFPRQLFQTKSSFLTTLLTMAGCQAVPTENPYKKIAAISQCGYSEAVFVLLEHCWHRRWDCLIDFEILGKTAVHLNYRQLFSPWLP
jgi:hypothetical protein